MSFENDIKQLRQEKNMTQQDLADYIHVSRQTVSAWERGKNYPSLDVLRSLSQLFEVSFEQILFGEEIQMKKEPTNLATTMKMDIKAKHRYKQILIGIVIMMGLLISAGATLVIGYNSGNSIIDRINPFLDYEVSYTKMPSEKSVHPNNKDTGGYWTKWFADNEMGTSWTKLTLTTGLNPDMKDPYVMAYHKGSYVKSARIVPGTAISPIIKSNLAALSALQNPKHGKYATNVQSQDITANDLKNKYHLQKTLQQINF